MVQDASIAPLVALKFLELEEMSRTPPLDPPVRQNRKEAKCLPLRVHRFVPYYRPPEEERDAWCATVERMTTPGSLDR